MHYKKELLATIHKHLPTATIYLFGSRARGTHNIGSDIDIAIDNKTKIDPLILGTIKEEIEESLIALFVDVVDFHAISPEMQKEIQKEGILWSI